MAEQMSFDNITVNALCQNAGIKRATFYKHFNDKYSFITFVTKSLRAEFDTKTSKRGIPEGSKEYFFEYTKAVLIFLEKNETAISRILESDMASTLVGIIVEQNYIDTEKRLDSSHSAALSPVISTNTVADMITGGVARIILRWFKEGKKKSADELAEEIRVILNKFSKNLLDFFDS